MSRTHFIVWNRTFSTFFGTFRATVCKFTAFFQIMELLKELQVKEGKSIVLITHNMGLVAEMADEVCVMYMGRVVEFGKLEDIFDNTCHPYTSPKIGRAHV